VATAALGRLGLGRIVVPLGPEADAGFDDVVGLGTPEDLTSHVGQRGVDPVALGTGMDPSLLRMWEDHIAGAVTVAHRVSPE
jgi:hypothetical protein